MQRPQTLDWARDAATWPHADKSRFVTAGGWRWHVQHHLPPTVPVPVAATATHAAAQPPGPRSSVLLLHGTGASAHSWRTLAPLLATRHEVIVPDLPGHAFTRAESRRLLTLPAMAQGVAALLRTLQVRPRWVIGHSAGAAVAARLCLDGAVQPEALVALNGALLPLQGTAGSLFSPMARWLALNPFVPHVFAWHAAQPALLRRLVESTGSRLDDEGRAIYGRLVRDPAHAAGALGMMASWDLRPLARELPDLPVPLELLVGEGDRTLPPAHAARVRSVQPRARVSTMVGLGHLMHEEDAPGVWALLQRLLPGLARHGGAARREPRPLEKA